MKDEPLVEQISAALGVQPPRLGFQLAIARISTEIGWAAGLCRIARLFEGLMVKILFRAEVGEIWIDGVLISTSPSPRRRVD